MNAEERDVALGALLRDLPTPDHAPGFFEALDARLQQEPNAITPVSGAVAETVAEAAAPVPVPAPVPLASRRRTRRRVFEVSALGAAAAIVAFAVIVGVDPGAGPLRPRPASAAEIVGKMTQAIAKVETLRGEFVVRDLDGTRKWTFVTTAKGDLRLTDAQMDLAYDASTGVERGISRDATTVFAGERTNIAPGHPDQGPPDWVLQRRLGSVTRALLAADHATVTETTWQGKPAWQLDSDVPPQGPAGDAAFDHIVVTIDQQTALPVRIYATRDGAFISEVTMDKLVIDSPVARSEFTLVFPPGLQVMRTDVGFRRVTLDQVAGQVGYRPLVPETLPGGYELSEVAVAQEGGHTGVEGMNPTSRKVVSMAYRRGLDRVVVTSRLRTMSPADHTRGISYPECRECLPGSDWSDPLASGEGIEDKPENFTVKGGALDGSPGQVLITPTAVPHVWVLSPDLVVTVSGDLTRAELLAAIGSLNRH